MALLEFSVIPIGSGESLGRHVAKCVEIVEHSGLNYRTHAMGTTVEGDLGHLLDVLKQCVESVSKECPRLTVTAKLDYRPDHPNELEARVARLEKQVGHAIKK